MTTREEACNRLIWPKTSTARYAITAFASEIAFVARDGGTLKCFPRNALQYVDMDILRPFPKNKTRQSVSLSYDRSMFEGIEARTDPNSNTTTVDGITLEYWAVAWVFRPSCLPIMAFNLSASFPSWPQSARSEEHYHRRVSPTDEKSIVVT